MNKAHKLLIALFFIFAFLNFTSSNIWAQSVVTPTPSVSPTINFPEDYREKQLQRAKEERDYLLKIGTMMITGGSSTLSFLYFLILIISSGENSDFRHLLKDLERKNRERKEFEEYKKRVKEGYEQRGESLQITTDKFETDHEYKTHTILGAFHEQALSELRWNTRTGRAMSVLGIAIIFLGAFLAVLDFAPVGGLAFLSGAIVEAVSYLFYKESNIARLRVQGIEQDLLRLEMAKSIDNTEKRDETIARIANSYLEPEPKELPSQTSSLEKPLRRRMKL
jgi:hypothetical protein